MIINQPLAMLHFYMYIPGNIKKRFDFLFSEVYRENIGLK